MYFEVYICMYIPRKKKKTKEDIYKKGNLPAMPDVSLPSVPYSLLD